MVTSCISNTRTSMSCRGGQGQSERQRATLKTLVRDSGDCGDSGETVDGGERVSGESAALLTQVRGPGDRCGWGPGLGASGGRLPPPMGPLLGVSCQACWCGARGALRARVPTHGARHGHACRERARLYSPHRPGGGHSATSAPTPLTSHAVITCIPSVLQAAECTASPCPCTARVGPGCSNSEHCSAGSQPPAWRVQAGCRGVKGLRPCALREGCGRAYLPELGGTGRPTLAHQELTASSPCNPVAVTAAVADGEGSPPPAEGPSP